MIFVILSFNSNCCFVFQESGQEKISQCICLLSLQLKIITLNMVMLLELSGDVTFLNHTFLHYSVFVWRKCLQVEQRKECGGESQNYTVVSFTENTQPLSHEEKAEVPAVRATVCWLNKTLCLSFVTTVFALQNGRTRAVVLSGGRVFVNKI